jgi:hypothetical protein
VTIFFLVRSSNSGISARCAAVKAPEVITLMSCVMVFIIMRFFENRKDLLPDLSSLFPPKPGACFIPKAFGDGKQICPEICGKDRTKILTNQKKRCKFLGSSVETCPSNTILTR